MCVGLAAIIVGGCGTSGGGPPGTPTAASPREQAPDKPVCAELNREGVVAAFDGSPCGWTLRVSADELLELTVSTPEPGRTSGAVPPGCVDAACVYRGTATAVGPVLIAEVVGTESEVPAGAWLGWVKGDSLSFVDLWEDTEPVLEQGISLGPAHGLAPYICGETLALFADARLPGADTVSPPPALVARQGPVEALDAPSGPAVDRSTCRRVAIGLP